MFCVGKGLSMPCAWFLFKTAQQLFSNLERVRSEGAPQLFTAHVPLEVVLPIALAQICNCWRPPGSFPTSQGEPKFLPSRDRLGVTRLIWQEKGDSQISASPCQISNSADATRFGTDSRGGNTETSRVTMLASSEAAGY